MIETDKMLHGSINFLIVLFGTFIIGLVGALVTAIVVSIAKELYDKYIQKTKFDWADIKADVIGMVLGTFCVALAQLLFV